MMQTMQDIVKSSASMTTRKKELDSNNFSTAIYSSNNQAQPESPLCNKHHLTMEDDDPSIHINDSRDAIDSTKEAYYSPAESKDTIYSIVTQDNNSLASSSLRHLKLKLAKSLELKRTSQSFIYPWHCLHCN